MSDFPPIPGFPLLVRWRLCRGSVSYTSLFSQRWLSTCQAGLFLCYDVEGLPRTNNALERCFGVARVHERRATGRRGAVPGVVVRGSVRVMTAVVSKDQVFSVEELRPSNYQRWRELRRHLQQCEETRRRQFRFRKDPATYLAALEAQLLT
jgi:hypothetical protein